MSLHGLGFGLMRPDKWFSDLVSITYRSLHLSNSLPMDSYCPITHSKILLCPPLNTSKRTTIHSFLSLFMLRHTSIHSYDIPEEANTGGRCAWSVQQTWPDTSLKWSARLATGVSADPLFNYLALAYKHTDALPMLLCSRIFRLSSSCHRHWLLYFGHILGRIAVCIQEH